MYKVRSRRKDQSSERERERACRTQPGTTPSIYMHPAWRTTSRPQYPLGGPWHVPCSTWQAVAPQLCGARHARGRAQRCHAAAWCTIQSCTSAAKLVQQLAHTHNSWGGRAGSRADTLRRSLRGAAWNAQCVLTATSSSEAHAAVPVGKRHAILSRAKQQFKQPEPCVSPIWPPSSVPLAAHSGGSPYSI